VWYQDAEAYLVEIRKQGGGYTYRTVAVSVWGNSHLTPSVSPW
jgi:hypothetical protein